MHPPHRRQYPSEENEDQKKLAKQKQVDKDRAIKVQQTQKEEGDSQRKWILQYMEQDASDESSQVSPVSQKDTCLAS